jgi:hypothetical protein
MVTLSAQKKEALISAQEKEALSAKQKENQKVNTQLLCYHRNNKPKTFYKITNKTENHHGFQYKEGLNILKQKFEPKVECGQGGLYCAEKKDILSWINLGYHIRKVHIPKDATVVKLANKYKTDRIILLDKYPLYSVDTLKKLKLNIDEDPYSYCYNYLQHTADSLDTQSHFYKKYTKILNFNLLIKMHKTNKNLFKKLLQNKIISKSLIKDTIQYVSSLGFSTCKTDLNFSSFLEEYLVKEVKI